MKHSDYILTGTARNLGRIDGTTRDTWIATVRIASADGGYATEHSGTGKDPRVAFRRAAGDALDALDSQSGDARERRRGVPMTGSVPRHDGELYPMPASGWTCFHCGETFFSIGTARDHFGHDPDATPACRLSPEHVRLELRRYRFLETELRAVLDELVDVRALGDGAPFLSHDSDRVYGLITRAIEAIAEDRLVGGS